MATFLVNEALAFLKQPIKKTQESSEPLLEWTQLSKNARICETSFANTLQSRFWRGQNGSARDSSVRSRWRTNASLPKLQMQRL
jgi:hypothetical protein